MDRRTGKTTRIIDEAVQKLFTHGIVNVYDHHPTKEAQEYTFDRLLKRLSFEHDLTGDSLHIDKSQLIIELKRKPNFKKMEYKKHKRKGALSELIKVSEFILHGGDLDDVSVSKDDQSLAVKNPNEFEQGFIARNPDNHEDKWYISKEYYDKNLEEVAEPKQETFFDRLVKERDELSEKLVKLESFLSDEPKAMAISGITQFELLAEQSQHMAAYLNVLDKRIIDLETSSATI